MFWFPLLLLTLLASAPRAECSCDTGVPHSYSLGPADVDLGEMEVFAPSPGRFLLLKREPGKDSVKVYEGSDNATWHRVHRQEEAAMSHLVLSSEANGTNVLYRQLEEKTVLERSIDGGRSWRSARLHFQFKDNEQKLERKLLKVTIVGTSGLTVYARIGIKDAGGPRVTPWPGVYISRDGGDDWQIFAVDLVIGTAVVEHDGTAFAVNPNGFVETKDNGRTWSIARIAQRLPKSFSIAAADKAPPDRRQKPLWVYQMAFPPNDSHSAFIVTNGGLFISHNGGQSWCLATFGSDTLDMVSSVALANPSGSSVFATTVDHSGPALWMSRNGGASFQRISVDAARQK